MITERLQTRAVAYESTFDQRIGLKASYIERQLDTFLGERLNVLLSKNKYEIKNNLMYGEDMDEPFIEVIKRGVDYRRKAEGENRVDKKREEAEIEGFLKIQDALCNPNTQMGTMMLSISPKGSKESLYQHNFYDIFTLKQAQGKRFIEARRYSSALSYEEYKDKLKLLLHIVDAPDDAYFLSHPVKIDPSTSLRVFFENADQIHSYLHKNHDFMKIEDFEKILLSLEGLKREYIIRRNPHILDAIMNKADIKAGFYDDFIIPSTLLTVDQEIDFLGRQPVRPVAAGCGSSGSVSGDKKSFPFSVSDFGMSDKYGDRKFECPECGKTNVRPENQLVLKCQHCNSSRVAC